MRQVSDVARLFEVDKNTIKRWCYEFADYLSSTATPPKGHTRSFDDSDVRVLALIFYYWEDEPDYEAIRYRLNSGYQDEDMYLDFVYLNTPIFREPPDDIDDRYEYCIMLNGEFLRSPREIARAYKTAGDTLVEQAISNYHPYQLDYPIFFNYRHAIELYLKILTGFDFEADKSHDLAELIDKLEAQYGARLPEWMKSRLDEFHKIDPGSDAFRYPVPSASDAKKHKEQLVWIDLYQLRTVIRILCEGFEKLIEQ